MRKIGAVPLRSMLTWWVVGGLVAAGVVSWPPTASAQATCEAFQLEYNQIDLGWNGKARYQPGLVGGQSSLAVASICEGTEDLCASNADCTGVSCVPSCEPGVDANVCRLSGPVEPMRCLIALTECSSDADCTAPEPCQRILSPPFPTQADGLPICVTMYSTDDITGTFDPATGASDLDLPLQRWRVHLGIALDRPCPRCGPPDVDPQIGQAFTCEGGSRSGAPCIVDAVSPYFGGVSYDCPASPNANVSGPGVAVRFGTATTSHLERQATLPCAFPLDGVHPSNGNAICLDDFSGCATNADCRRCTDDLTACQTNADCQAGAACAEAPDQPIACGLYCHCGFCGNQLGEPCFSDADCAPGVACSAGMGANATQPQPQSQPNDCANLICGESAPEQCCTGSDCINGGGGGSPPKPPLGTCSLAPYRTCDSHVDCATEGAGVCERYPIPCFGNRIERDGEGAPATAVCTAVNGKPPCVTNADCASGPCELACPTPVWTSLACVANTTSSAVNAVFGLPGPIAMRFNGGYTPPAKLPATTTTTTSTTTTTHTTVTTLPPLTCPDQPSSACLEAGGAKVRLRNAGRTENRALSWRWRMGELVDKSDLADPTSDTNHALCVYDSSAGVAALSSELSIPAGLHWTDTGPDGFVYVDPSLSADGVKRLRLKAGVAGQSGARLAAFGPRVPLAPAATADRYFAQDPRVTIQLHASTGACWTSEFVEGDVLRNRPRKFRATRTPGN